MFDATLGLLVSLLDIFSRDIISVCLLISIAVIGRAALVAMGQRWASTFAHTATLTTLPIITFVITKVISGNIALSLGMIGALSIVRFRNPVRSPFELSVYFAAITLGITASVSLQWLLFFVFALGLALVVMVIVSFTAKRITGKPYFETSFSEGNRLSTLEVESNNAIRRLQDSQYLISESRRDEKYMYILSSDRFSVLQLDMRSLEEEASIIEVRLNK